MTENKNSNKNNKRVSNGRLKERMTIAREYFTPGRLRLFLSILCIAAIAITTWMAWPSFYQTEKHSIDGAIDYLPYRLNEGDVLVQPFIPTHEGLNSFYLSFDLAHDWEVPEQAQLLLEFFDIEAESETGAVQENSSEDSTAVREPAYTLSVSGADINRYTQTELKIDLGSAAMGKEYELALTVLDMPDDQYMYIHTNSAKTRPLIVNGKTTGLALTMTLIYRSFDWFNFRLSLLLISVVLFLLILPARLIGGFFSKYIAIPLLLAPAMLVIMVELFNTLNHNIWLKVQIFWLSYIILLLIELIFVGIIGSCRLGIYLNLAIFAGLSIGNHTKLFFRGDPFVAGDLRILTEAAQTVNDLQFHANSRFLLGWLVLIIYAIIFINIQKRERSRKQRIIMIVAPIAAFALYMPLLILSPARLDNVFKVSRYPWNNMMNYKLNGFTIPFFQSIHHLVITQPDQNRVTHPSFYQLPYEHRIDDVDPAKPHIVAIMSESYADFNNIRSLETSEPVMPFYDWLKGRPESISGNLLVSVFGGGTCNTEFEYLTGSSMLFMNDGITPYTSYFDRPTHSLAQLYKDQGYSTLAIHPYYRTFWDRHKVYPNMGFDEFIALEDFEEGGEVRQFKGDRAAFNQIKSALDSNEPGERQFIFTVTMQNHFPYYGEEEILADLNYNIRMPGMLDAEGVELYLNILRESDDALRELVMYLQELDEPVMLVFFGDHLPGNNNVFNHFYEELFEKPITDLSPSETQKMHETPYLIWTNYDLSSQLGEDVAGYAKTLTSPNFLATTTIELSRAGSSPYFNMVADLQKDIEAMNNRLIILQSGRRINREQIPPALTRKLDRYWRYEYDNIIAKREEEQ
ncbi:MAG: LTA synthase family protein [Clostridiaceae bacterium]|nr:LTA synthase family protein [Clostridiaceae bacterium]